MYRQNKLTINQNINLSIRLFYLLIQFYKTKFISDYNSYGMDLPILFFNTKHNT